MKNSPVLDETEKPDPLDKPFVREITSEELLRGQSELRIRYGEDLHWLKLTRNGKLISHK